MLHLEPTCSDRLTTVAVQSCTTGNSTVWADFYGILSVELSATV